ncbi:hypothetical protein AAGG74_14525 [Bacillus mexicanus]|uniref:hypothetical protein n=1 Tax=Bacillus mexicanus TaxID=2834415 RepID=UPI003D1EF9C3
MFKRFILAFSFIALFFPQHHISASQNSTYYNPEFKYSISFPNDWYIFSDEMKQNLSPEERENSPAIFIRKDGLSQMFIRHLSSSTEKYKLYKNVIDYAQKTSDDKQNMNRVLNPISVTLGRTITGYKVDELNETIELQLTQTSPQFGEIYTTLFWKEYKGTLIELEFYHFENNSTLLSEASQINNSFTISSDVSSSNIKEGSIDFLNTKMLTNNGQDDDTFFSKTIDIVCKPIVWISFVGIMSLLIITRIIYKLI